MVKVVHYLNQFFAGIGGEEKAGYEAVFMPHAVGVGAVIENSLADYGVEYATIVCGDNYFHESEERVLKAMREFVDRFEPNIFVAGPAFNAGRYGIACAKMCSWVRDNWRIPAITAMHEENPGTREIGRHVFVVQTGPSTASMQNALKRIALLMEQLLVKNEDASENFRAEYCVPIPRRFTVRTGTPDYVRAVDLLMAKLNRERYESEIPQLEAQPHAIPNLSAGLRKRRWR